MNVDGYVLWLMGPTSSGKTTLAEALVERLRARGVGIIHFDGDDVRNWFGPDYGFSESDRNRVVAILSELANRARAAGLNVVISALTAHESARAYIGKHIPDLIVGSIRCPIAVCETRDPKGLYARARRGEITTLIGVNQPYIEPTNPDIVLDSERSNVNQLVDRLIEYLSR